MATHSGHTLHRQALNGHDSSCFEYEPVVLRKLVKRIPHATDLLLTHAPARGFLDVVTVTDTVTDENTGRKVTSKRTLHCGELELLERQIELKAEAESEGADARTAGAGAAADAGPARECWPCCCHNFGHVHATQHDD